MRSSRRLDRNMGNDGSPHSAADRNENNVLRKRASEYRRLSTLARDVAIAQQLSVFAEAYLTLAAKLNGPRRATE
jgi:hypothetical protein